MTVEDDDAVDTATETEDEDAQMLGGAPSDFYVNYELLGVLGRGLASTVRACLDKKTQRKYAVKIVDITTEHQNQIDATRLASETHAEIRILKQLQGHPSIMTLHDVFESSTYIFLVFEMAPLGELFDVLTKDVTFSEKRTKRTMRQILSGIQHMHSQGIVHRDIKLENVLCIDANTCKLTDFGFATEMPKSGLLRELFGTPGYLAPETLKAQMYEDAPGYGMPVDVWACGVIMYTLLCGQAPFYHRQQMKMLRLIQEGKYSFATEAWASVSDEAKDLISKLLVVDVEKRLTAAEALRHPFLEVTTAQITEAPTGVNKALWRWKRAMLCARFMVRLARMPASEVTVDREMLRQRPFRDRAVRHTTEATVFAVYGHWVNKGFLESRDQLFANRPKPKRTHAVGKKGPNAVESVPTKLHKSAM